MFLWNVQRAMKKRAADVSFVLQGFGFEAIMIERGTDPSNSAAKQIIPEELYGIPCSQYHTDS